MSSSSPLGDALNEEGPLSIATRNTFVLTCRLLQTSAKSAQILEELSGALMSIATAAGKTKDLVVDMVILLENSTDPLHTRRQLQELTMVDLHSRLTRAVDEMFKSCSNAGPNSFNSVVSFSANSVLKRFQALLSARAFLGLAESV
ncbi:hypothetical protein EIP86_002406 [Pleurotus ostreatoroseus]|nr:hypothetical protein EIP86_002406 [Pleurotus ostreatoroseus]